MTGRERDAGPVLAFFIVAIAGALLMGLALFFYEEPISVCSMAPCGPSPPSWNEVTLTYLYLGIAMVVLGVAGVVLSRQTKRSASPKVDSPVR